MAKTAGKRTRPSREHDCTKIARLSKRWCIPEEDLSNQVQHELWSAMFEGGPKNVPARQLDRMASLLDELFPADMQWNFWYRPSIVNDVPPVCRVGWESPGGLLNTILDELETLVGHAGRLNNIAVDAKIALKLFKPALIYKRLDWMSGYCVTEVRIEARAIRHNPLQFAAEQTAPYVAQCPFHAKA